MTTSDFHRSAGYSPWTPAGRAANTLPRAAAQAPGLAGPGATPTSSRRVVPRAAAGQTPPVTDPLRVVSGVRRPSGVGAAGPHRTEVTR
jgi:hypothetical protein